jgi:hypothetical protein
VLTVVYNPTLTTHCSSNSTFYCLMYADEGVFSDKAKSSTMSFHFFTLKRPLRNLKKASGVSLAGAF